MEIIDEQLSLKRGHASKGTDGRIDLLVTYDLEYIGIVELKLGELGKKHLQQLEDYLAENNQITAQYPDILNQEESSAPKWIGVLVGTSVNPELAGQISSGYITNSGVPIAALTIQRFRSAIGSVYVTTDTYFKSLSSKDTTKYIFDGKPLGKGRLVLAVVKQYIQDNPDLTFSELEKRFGKAGGGAQGVFSTAEEANKTYTATNRWRHFAKPDELIKLSDATIAVSNQWGIKGIAKFLPVAKKLGYSINPIRL